MPDLRIEENQRQIRIHTPAIVRRHKMKSKDSLRWPARYDGEIGQVILTTGRNVNLPRSFWRNIVEGTTYALNFATLPDTDDFSGHYNYIYIGNCGLIRSVTHFNISGSTTPQEIAEMQAEQHRRGDDKPGPYDYLRLARLLSIGVNDARKE